MADQHYLRDYGWTHTATEVVEGVTVDLWQDRDGNRAEVHAHPAPWDWDAVTAATHVVWAHLEAKHGGPALGGYALLGYWDLPADPVARFREAERQGALRFQDRQGAWVDWDAEWHRERPTR